jgi:ClpP class serine protease
MGKKFGRNNLDEAFSFFIDQLAQLDGASDNETEEIRQRTLTEGAITLKLKLLYFLVDNDLLESAKAVQFAFYLGQNNPDFQFPDKA